LHSAKVEGDISTLRFWVTFQLWVYKEKDFLDFARKASYRHRLARLNY